MKKLLLFLIPFFLCSCKNYFDYMDSVSEYCERISIQGVTEIYEGGFGYIYISATPSDSFDYYDAQFSLSNSDYCQIKETGENYCVVYGKKKGSCVVTAKLNTRECKGVINVIENK